MRTVRHVCCQMCNVLRRHIGTGQYLTDIVKANLSLRLRVFWHCFVDANPQLSRGLYDPPIAGNLYTMGITGKGWADGVGR